MIAALLSALFAGCALLAFGAIVVTVRQYAASALAVREQLHACPPSRDLRYAVRAVGIRHGEGVVIHADFARKLKVMADRSVLPAAA